jgi:hypothetical protein
MKKARIKADADAEKEHIKVALAVENSKHRFFMLYRASSSAWYGIMLGLCCYAVGYIEAMGNTLDIMQDILIQEDHNSGSSNHLSP